jgi:hypothetical protein
VNMRATVPTSRRIAFSLDIREFSYGHSITVATPQSMREELPNR